MFYALPLKEKGFSLSEGELKASVFRTCLSSLEARWRMASVFGCHKKGGQ